VPRLALALTLVAALAWSCLLFGIGLDDLGNSRTAPGVIFSVLVLPVLIAGIGCGLWRVIGPTVRKRLARISYAP
jgi:hypothetical protein